jgi:hypothetical protein
MISSWLKYVQYCFFDGWLAYGGKAKFPVEPVVVGGFSKDLLRPKNLHKRTVTSFLVSRDFTRGTRSGILFLALLAVALLFAPGTFDKIAQIT